MIQTIPLVVPFEDTEGVEPGNLFPVHLPTLRGGNSRSTVHTASEVLDEACGTRRSCKRTTFRTDWYPSYLKSADRKGTNRWVEATNCFESYRVSFGRF